MVISKIIVVFEGTTDRVLLQLLLLLVVRKGLRFLQEIPLALIENGALAVGLLLGNETVQVLDTILDFGLQRYPSLVVYLESDPDLDLLGQLVLAHFGGPAHSLQPAGQFAVPTALSVVLGEVCLQGGRFQFIGLFQGIVFVCAGISWFGGSSIRALVLGRRRHGSSHSRPGSSKD